MYMKKIYTTKLNTSLIPQHRSLGRRIKQMFTSIIKRQNPVVADDLTQGLMQLLKTLQDRIEAVERQMTQQIKLRKK